MTERDDRWFRLTLFAVRLEGEDGWIVDEAPFSLPEIEARIRGNGYEIAEIREISSGLSRRRDEDGSPKVDGPMAWYVRSWGWAYDQQAQCWRAPGEMVCEPAGVPARAESFAVRSGAPNAGWWPIVISADAARVEISASNVHDPVRDLLAWLERLVNDSAARVLIDEEGDQTEILVYPQGQGIIRFVVIRYGETDEKRIDVLLSLRDVVAQFYAALQELVRDETVQKRMGGSTSIRAPWHTRLFRQRASRRSWPRSAPAERCCRNPEQRTWAGSARTNVNSRKS